MPAPTLSSLLPPIATAVICLTALLLTRRKSVLLCLTAALLTLAAADLHVSLQKPGTVAVLVDVSPSTRTAAYRDEAALRRRLTELLPGTHYTAYHFADALHDGLSTLELPANHTVFTPPANADAILLFSDGQFPLPGRTPAPTYPILDPNLDHVEDARLTALTPGPNHTLTATATNTTPTPQSVQWTGLPTTTTDPLPQGTHTLTHGLPPQSSVLSPQSSITARVTGSDPWPENDALALRPPPPDVHELWWVSATRPPPSPFIPVSPNNLPTDPSQYLRPAAIVLDNLAAADLPQESLPLLTQYVRDLGGTLVLQGGDRAFADYLGTDLESLSPLATAPPKPERHWLLLLDASGSMAQDGKWSRALAALTRVLPSIPPDDLVSIGSFANDTTWWIESPAKSLVTTALPPKPITPHGPTNLPTALAALAPKGPATALLITDAELTLPDADAQAGALTDHQIHVSALVISENPPGALATLTTATGGALLTDPNPARWLRDLRHLTTRARPPAVDPTPTTVTFEGPLSALPPRRLASHNRTYPKPNTTTLAAPFTQSSVLSPQSSPLAATWHVGTGQAAALAFNVTPQETTTLTRLLARPPADPTLTARWTFADRLTVSVDTPPTSKTYTNNANVTLKLDTTTTPIPQTAPGQYALTLPYPTDGATARLYANGKLLSQTTLPHRYPEEFAALGTDYPTLTTLAERSHATLIPPDQHTPIDFHWPIQPHPLTPYLAALATATLLTHLLRRRHP